MARVWPSFRERHRTGVTRSRETRSGGFGFVLAILRQDKYQPTRRLRPQTSFRSAKGTQIGAAVSAADWVCRPGNVGHPLAPDPTVDRVEPGLRRQRYDRRGARGRWDIVTALNSWQ
jgi:hypothetical protein